MLYDLLFTNFHVLGISLPSSTKSAAKASGFPPSSNNCAQMFKVSRSRPVPNKFDISKTTKIKVVGGGGVFQILNVMLCYVINIKYY